MLHVLYSMQCNQNRSNSQQSMTNADRYEMINADFSSSVIHLSEIRKSLTKYLT